MTGLEIGVIVTVRTDVRNDSEMKLELIKLLFINVMSFLIT